MMQPEKIPGPAKAGREAIYSKDGQDFAHRSGAYGYQDSVAFVPKMAAIAGYVKHFELASVLDIGCGTGNLLRFLDKSIRYVGVDISPCAISEAKRQFPGRDTVFLVADFTRWDCADDTFDGVIWAGIDQAWGRKGRGDDRLDWLDIITRADGLLKRGGRLILEAVTEHWMWLAGKLEREFVCVAGCDINCIQSEESPRRFIRVLHRRNL